LSDLERAATTYFAENAPHSSVQKPPVPAIAETSLGNLARAVQNYLPALTNPIS
jgi:hypothetical protein